VVNAVIVPESDGRWQDYAGGYTDMLAQRGRDLMREPVKSSPAKEAKAAEPAATREQTSSKRRLSFNEKHALETLPKTIAALTDKIRALNTRLEDPSLYGRDRKAFDETSAALAAAQTELSAAEERWLDLEMIREEIERQ
jgi:ATP-binding cassette subfamily F protein uup